MNNNCLKLDSAMNMIKENLVRDLSDAVIKTSRNKSNVFNDVSFSGKHMD